MRQEPNSQTYREYLLCKVDAMLAKAGCPNKS